MTAWYSEMQLQGSGPLDDARFDALADALAEIDAADPAVTDADLTGSLTGGWVTASMVVQAEDVEDAVRKTVAVVRAAIHRTGDSTPDWDRITDLPAITVRPSESVPAA